MQANYREALLAAEHAADGAKVAGDDRTLGEAEAMRGLALLYLGRVEQALDVLRVEYGFHRFDLRERVSYPVKEIAIEHFCVQSSFICVVFVDVPRAEGKAVKRS